MKTDRELLELAAKAAGISPQWRTASSLDCKNAPDPIGWNPLLNDGDALRLAVKLGIALDRTESRCWAFAAGRAVQGVCEESYNDNPCAATRRAIVRAAALALLAAP